MENELHQYLTRHLKTVAQYLAVEFLEDFICDQLAFFSQNFDIHRCREKYFDVPITKYHPECLSTAYRKYFESGTRYHRPILDLY